MRSSSEEVAVAGAVFENKRGGQERGERRLKKIEEEKKREQKWPLKGQAKEQNCYLEYIRIYIRIRREYPS